MSDNIEQLSLIERWNLDLESYNRGANILTSTPQCKKCYYYIERNALHCEKFIDNQKPKYVMFPSKECEEFHSNDAINIKPQTVQEDILYGGMMGFCVGDALGVPVEFSSREERKGDPVQEMRAYGTHHQSFGTWSDDTSLMLCLLECILDGYSIEKLAKKFILFYTEGYLTPNGEVFDIGISTRKAIEKMMRGIEPVKCGGAEEGDNGNGSLMRILPLAFWLKEYSPQKQIEIVEEVSSLTHLHKRSKLACIIYIRLAIELFERDSKENAYKRMLDFIKMYCSSDYLEEIKFYNNIMNSELLDVDEQKISSSGYVIDTLEAAIWVFFHSNDYRGTVLNAINLGGDTDTIAAVVGGLAGIYYGFNSIPDNWVQCLERNKEISKMIICFKNYLYNDSN